MFGTCPTFQLFSFWNQRFTKEQPSDHGTGHFLRTNSQHVSPLALANGAQMAGKLCPKAQVRLRILMHLEVLAISCPFPRNWGSKAHLVVRFTNCAFHPESHQSYIQSESVLCIQIYIATIKSNQSNLQIYSSQSTKPSLHPIAIVTCLHGTPFASWRTTAPPSVPPGRGGSHAPGPTLDVSAASSSCPKICDLNSLHLSL